jgi:hypothetical protein
MLFYLGDAMTIWVNELDNIKAMLENSVSLDSIGNKYGVSKQRIYQVLTKYGITTPVRERKNFLRDKEPKVFWLDRILRVKKISKADRVKLLESMNIPDLCPIFNIPLNYDGVEKQGWTRTDNSPSLDRIDSNKGYTMDNIHIISWRANRIKNDSTVEELRMLADYMEALTKNNLQL